MAKLEREDSCSFELEGYDRTDTLGRNSIIYKRGGDVVKILKQMAFNFDSSFKEKMLAIAECYKILQRLLGEFVVEVNSFSYCVLKDGSRVGVVKMEDAGVVDQRIDGVQDRHVEDAADRLAATRVYGKDILTRYDTVNVGNVAFRFENDVLHPKILDVDDTSAFVVGGLGDVPFLKKVWRYVISICIDVGTFPVPPASEIDDFLRRAEPICAKQDTGSERVFTEQDTAVVLGDLTNSKLHLKRQRMNIR